MHHNESFAIAEDHPIISLVAQKTGHHPMKTEKKAAAPKAQVPVKDLKPKKDAKGGRKSGGQLPA